MASTMHGEAGGGLERSCGRDWVRIGAARPGLQRVEVCFATQAFAPHRHDTYTIGVTLQGVQEFGYRGRTVRSAAGQVFVLHPDELHDGRPGSESGFRYRTLYVEPHLIQAALETRSLPFLREAVSDDAGLRAAILAALEDWDVALDDLQFDRTVLRLAEALAALDPSSRSRLELPERRGVNAARNFLDANFLETVSSPTLERISGLSRFALTRHFRDGFGTSPHRYVIMRRLDHARALIRAGTALAEAASASGFADQAHMTRHFKKAYGVSPARWRAMVA